ncbi:MAG: homocysteine S-methyltransferase family protein [Gemmatimonadota bacterium]|nr:homocysteine S-methyltransferase family protein [Gemmatimonadota bacterium]MDH5758927.1 homocysteine S-methyltransferase family protein [Gemmatimonadota bacterium]
MGDSGRGLRKLGSLGTLLFLAEGGESPILADGATGTELQRSGVEPGGCLEALNVERPDVVLALHRSYLDAGSDLVTTNSFGGTRLRLRLHDMEGRAAEFNRAAARLAREAAGDDAFVLGDVGPTGSILAPLGDVTPDEAYDAFREQIDALLEGGADGILIETLTALDEMEAAVRAARDAGAPLVLASFAFDRVKTGIPRTMMGLAPAEAARAAAEAGADLVGCNCGTSLTGDEYVSVVAAMREATGLPLLAQPNAGLPELTRDGVVYHETPASMAATIHRLVEAGALVVGGCCGSTPEHITAFRRILDRPRND